MKKVFLLLSLLSISFAFQNCEKEIIGKETNIETYSQEIKKKPSLSKLAAILGISVDNIVRVEHRDGYYHCYNEYYENGKIKTHYYWCTPPNDAYCCSVVYIHSQISAKGFSNGYLGVRKDKSNQVQSIIMIFDMDEMSNTVWVQDSTINLVKNHPIANAHDLGLCTNKQYVSLPIGSFQLSRYDSFKYFEINASDLVFSEGNLIEQ